jgi:hypothetical protein
MMDIDLQHIIGLPVTGMLLYFIRIVYAEYKDEKQHARKITADSIDALNKNTEALNNLSHLVKREK